MYTKLIHFPFCLLSRYINIPLFQVLRWTESLDFPWEWWNFLRWPCCAVAPKTVLCGLLLSPSHYFPKSVEWIDENAELPELSN